MPQTLSQIKSLLAERGLHPRRGLGQNFLIDQNKLRAILDAANLRPGEIVLEVGPGTGTLTEAMLDAGARVLAVEIDHALVDILRERIGPDRENWTLLHADALAGKHALNPRIVDGLEKLAAPDQSKIKNQKSQIPFQLIANLPYQIASPLLATLAMDWPGMHAAVVMIQREVADRLTAPPGNKIYGPIGVLIQSLLEVERIAALPPACFWPRPKVNSAVLRLTRREHPLTDDPHALAALLHRLFSKRRKQLGGILGRDTPLPSGIDPSQRPEQLSVEQLITLAETTAHAEKNP